MGLPVRHVLAGEQDRLRALRLRALESDPGAFGSTFAAEAARPPEWWATWAASSEAGDTERTFVGETDGCWVGLALARTQDDGPGAAMLNAMWVAPEARGRRLARALCDACAAWAAGRGFAEIVLEVAEDNHAARRAYEAAGFEVAGLSTWSSDGQIVQELLMRRALPSSVSPAHPTARSGAWPHGYTGGMTSRVGPKGQVVVPKAIRDRLGIAPGDQVVVEEADGAVRIRRPRVAADLLGLLGPDVGLDDLAAERRQERERES
jgi:AbrB family looped-hinge helix DNA binding protein